ncbi:MAG: D-lyxose/D-mannose family sugar isomerase, partial [Opitutaceae bacterium]
MKPSEINRHLVETLRFFDAMKVPLPQWGCWKPADWKAGQRHSPGNLAPSCRGAD